MCLYTRMIKNKKYTKTEKNEGLVPLVPDIRVEYVPVGCGNCKECKSQQARNWQLRMLEHIKKHTNGKFITLTLSNQSINELLQKKIKKTDKETGEIITTTIENLRGYERDNAIATKAMRDFNERYRKITGNAIHHWFVTELGHQGTENIHLHGIIWENCDIETIRALWAYGWIWPRPETKQQNYVSARTVNYIIKYITKTDLKHKEYKAVVLCSPGIGANYITDKAAEVHQYKGTKTQEAYRTSTGHMVAVPIYWRNKLWTDEERERLWIQRLDAQIRWVWGEKVDISKGDKEFNELTQWYRRKNTELGYGGQTNENRKEHEENKRELMLLNRIKNYRDKKGNY